MDNQQIFDPQNQNNQETPSQPLNNSPTIPPELSGPSNFNPTYQSPIPGSTQKQGGPIRAIAIILIVIFVLSGAYLLLTHKHKATNLASHQVSKNTNAPTPASSNEGLLLGRAAKGTGDAVGWSVKVSKVIPNPQTTGDKPDSGTSYLEIVVAIKDPTLSNPDSTSLVSLPGSLYYQTAGGKIYADTGTSGTDDSGPIILNKDVMLVDAPDKGANSISGLQVPDPNDPQLMDELLLFQVPNGDNGKLVWYAGNFQTDTKIATFELK